jgi:hypothetical protein
MRVEAMRRLTYVFPLAALLAGCVTGSNVERVEPGMDREQVYSIMGPPEGMAHSPGKDCAYYRVLKDFWMRTPWSMSNRYYVCYTDGRVDTFGRADTPTVARTEY